MKDTMKKYIIKFRGNDLKIEDVTENKKVDCLRNDMMFHLIENNGQLILNGFAFLSGDSYKIALIDKENKKEVIYKALCELSSNHFSLFINQEQIQDIKIYINFRSNTITLNKTEFFGYLKSYI